MAKTLTVDTQYKADFNYKDSTRTINEDRGKFTLNTTIALTTGTATDQSDLLWEDTRTLDAASEDLDLAGGLTDVHGDAITIVEVTGIVIKNRNTTAGHNLAIGGAAGNQFINWVANSSDILNIGPTGRWTLESPIDGYAVTAGTGDLLKIDAGANTVTFDIAIWGRSA